MLTEEIRKALSLPAAPLPRPEVVAQKYRSLPAEHRKAVNALHRAGGEMALSEFAFDPRVRAALGELGFAYVLSDPDRVVVPLETLFAVPLIEGNPETLVEALRGYSSDALRKIAAAVGVEAAGLDDVALRARLHRAASSGRTLEGIDSELLEGLCEIAEGVGPEGLPIDRLCRALEIPSPGGGGVFVDAFPAQEGPLGDLARRMVVTPVLRRSEGSRWCLLATVPLEVRRALRTALGDRGRSNCAEQMERVTFRPSSEGAGGGVAKLLLALEQETVGVTQAGKVNRRNLAKVARRLGWNEEEAARLSDLAILAGMVEVVEGRTRVRPSAVGWKFLAATPSGRGEILFRQAREGFRMLAAGISQALRDELERAIFAELDPQARPGTKVCLHCAAGRAMEAVLRSGPRRSAFASGARGFVRPVVRVIGAFFFRFGLAEGAAEENQLRYLRWTGAGGPAGEDPPGRVTVQPTGEVIVPPGALPAEDLARLARAAEPRGVDPALVFALTRGSIFEAARRGEDPAKLREVLEARSGRPLPKTVAFLLEEAASRAGEVRIVPCSAIVEVRDPSMLEGLGLVRIADRIAGVPPEMDPGAIRRALERKGYFVKVDDDPPPSLASEMGEDGEEDPCHSWAGDEKGILERVRHSCEFGEGLEVEVRGGRRHLLEGISRSGGRIEGWDAATGRRTMLDLAAISRARSAPA